MRRGEVGERAHFVGDHLAALGVAEDDDLLARGQGGVQLLVECLTPSPTDTFHVSHPSGPDLHQPGNGNGQNDCGVVDSDEVWRPGLSHRLAAHAVPCM